MFRPSTLPERPVDVANGRTRLRRFLEKSE